MASLNLVATKDIYYSEPGSGYGPLQLMKSSGSYIYVRNDWVEGDSGSILAYTFNGTNYTRVGTLNPTPAGFSSMYVDTDARIAAVFRDTATEILRTYTFDGANFTQFGTSGNDTGRYDVRSCIDANGVYDVIQSPSAAIEGYTNASPNLSLQDTEPTTLVYNMGTDGTYLYTIDFNTLKAWTFNGSSFAQVGSYSHGGIDAYRLAPIKKLGAYVCICATEGLHLFSFDGANFTLESVIDPGTGWLEDVEYDGTYWYLANGDEGVRMYSFDGTTWTLEDTFLATDPSEWYFGVVKVGSYVHAVDYYNIRAFSVSGGTDPVSADFNQNKTNGYAPLSVRFTDLSTSGSSIVSWLWTFGDGKTSTDQNPSHVYYYPGVYTVSLTAVNSSGVSGTETKVRTLQVALAPPTLSTYDLAPPQNDEILAHMLGTGSGDVNMYGRGVRYYIRTSVTSPDKSGFRRPAGPSLIFD